ncbi:hypothetical protein JWG45_11950 [Leptospira sp. 201903070]|uniref:Lipoprotein n=1 Tax=Leptospira ainlahdjerensis TaxID=2810033 RepID=A0ABS2UBV6_9LEPT|nr:hypothetical protein [Leptospira ainlahdjerensis]MBM9577859.1 hypothetical protein [Leptospira ainlahdjerensis]
MKILNCILVFVLAFTSCAHEVKERIHVDTGVTVKTLGPHNYELVSIGQASASSIEENDKFKMQNTSCTAAKTIATRKLEELEPDQKNRQFFLELKNTKYLEEGVYCEITYHYELPTPKK